MDNHFPSAAGHTIPDTSQEAFGLLGHLGTLLYEDPKDPRQAAVPGNLENPSCNSSCAEQVVQKLSWTSPAVHILLNKYLVLGKHCMLLQEKKNNDHFSVTNAMESSFRKQKIKTSDQNQMEIKRNPSDC